MFNHLDLCSGIGGFALGFEWAGLSQPVMFCDNEKWCQKILRKHWPDVPIADDVKELANDPEKIPELGRYSVLTAGYPCQPFSYAGQRRGTEDDRHIWPHIRKIVQFKRPTWCVFENVYGHLTLGLDQVLSDLEADGYATRPFIVPAAGVDASHRRDRIWILGYTEHDGPSATEVTGELGQDEKRRSEGQSKAEQSAGTGEPRDDADVGYSESVRWQWRPEPVGREGAQNKQKQRPSLWSESGRPSENVSNTNREGLEGAEWQGFEGRGKRPAIRSLWLPEPAVGRVANGIPGRVDRIKGLGNAIVPQIAMRIGTTIKQIEGAF